MMKNKKVKYIFNLAIMFVVIFLVLYFSLKDSFDSVIANISKMSFIYLFIAIIVMILYRLFLSISLCIVTSCNNYKYSVTKSLKLNFITQFFNGVTPFASGGQPSQIYYLHQENIPVATATNIVLQNFILYQTALILFGVFAVSFNAITSLFPKDNFVANLVLLGFIINFLVWIGSFIISFGKKISSFIVNKVIKFFAKIKIIKDYLKTKEKFSNYVNSFYSNTMILKNNKKQVVIGIFVNVIALLLLYSVPFIIMKGLGISSYVNYLTTVVAVSYVMLIGSFVPIPGGTGGIEFGFVHFFGYFVTDSLLVSLMLVWRFVTYYLGMIFGGLMIPFYKKKE